MARKESTKPQLNPQHRKFAEIYLSNGFNGTRAAIEAGYAPRSAHVQASRLLKNDKVIAYIDGRMKALSMRADEVIYRLSEHGRGDLREFMGLTTTQLIEHPKGWLLKKHKAWREIDEHGKVTERVEIEIHDVQAALNILAKHHKLLTDKIEVADWRREAQDSGVDPNLLKEQRVQELLDALRKETHDDTSSGAV